MKQCENVFDFGEYFDFAELERSVLTLQSKYDFLDIGTLGKSIFGKSIPMISYGKGAKSLIYIGAHHGMEWITSALLTKFLFDLCEEYERGGAHFGISARVLFDTRRIHIIPMLNPDGVSYAIHGVDESNILRSRLIGMNGSDDFSHWQANGRGVDLNHNYRSGFEEYKALEKDLGIFGGAPSKYSGEYPESEPEVKALCDFVRFERPSMALTLHTQGEEIYYTSGANGAFSPASTVNALSRLTGYSVSRPNGSACYGGFTDWFIDEFAAPSFTLECGRGKNPLPFSDMPSIYSRIKRALFTAPVLI